MTFIVKEHIWLSEDGELVPNGDPRARFLKYPAGTELTDHEAKAAGLPLKDEPEPELEAEPEAEPEPKPRARRPRTKGQ